MLTKKFLLKQKRVLLAKKRSVVAAIRKLNDQPLTDHVLYKLTTELPLIERALTRIEKGIYGRCVNCREDIPAARLTVRPETVRCVDCQAQYERFVHDQR